MPPSRPSALFPRDRARQVGLFGRTKRRALRSIHGAERQHFDRARVFQDLEVHGCQSTNELAAAVRHHDVDLDQVHTTAYYSLRGAGAFMAPTCESRCQATGQQARDQQPAGWGICCDSRRRAEEWPARVHDDLARILRAPA